MKPLIKPRHIKVANRDEIEKEFIISRLPATVAREVIAKYPLSNIPKIGDYKTSEEVMMLLMKYVAVMIDGTEQRLVTRDLVDNHVDDGMQLLKLELQMIEENTGFFGLEGKQGFLDSLISKFAHLITPMLTGLLDQSSAQDSQNSQS